MVETRYFRQAVVTVSRFSLSCQLQLGSVHGNRPSHSARHSRQDAAGRFPSSRRVRPRWAPASQALGVQLLHRDPQRFLLLLSPPVFFCPCPRACPPSGKSPFMSDKAMGHAVTVGPWSKTARSSGCARAAGAPRQAGLRHSRRGALPARRPRHARNRLPTEKLKFHPTCQSSLIQEAQRFFHNKS